MRISIITVVYNNDLTIAHAIESVLAQQDVNLQYIVVDGDSKDDTKAIIKTYRNRIHQFVSEPDNGIYDAMNKGIILADGDVIGILNSDDFYANEFVLRNVMDVFEKQDIDCLYGDIEYVSNLNINRVIRKWHSGALRPFSTGWHPPHPGFFVRKEIYNRYGVYRTDFKIASDFELMLRMIERNKCSTHYINEVVVKMRVGGKSNQSINNILTGYSEIKRAFQLNDIKMPVVYPLYRYIPKLKDILLGQVIDSI